MAEPFQRLAANRGFLASFFVRVGKTSLVREIEDELARAARVSDVAGARLGELAASRGVDFARRHRTARCQLYRRFLEHCLEDQAGSAEESADLVHLRSLLGLDDADVARLHEEVVHSVYGRALDQVLKRLDPDEEEFLRQLGWALQISPDAGAES